MRASEQSQTSTWHEAQRAEGGEARRARAGAWPRAAAPTCSPGRLLFRSRCGLGCGFRRCRHGLQLQSSGSLQLLNSLRRGCFPCLQRCLQLVDPGLELSHVADDVLEKAGSVRPLGVRDNLPKQIQAAKAEGAHAGLQLLCAPPALHARMYA